MTEPHDGACTCPPCAVARVKERKARRRLLAVARANASQEWMRRVVYGAEPEVVSWEELGGD